LPARPTAFEAVGRARARPHGRPRDGGRVPGRRRGWAVAAAVAAALLASGCGSGANKGASTTSTSTVGASSSTTATTVTTVATTRATTTTTRAPVKPLHGQLTVLSPIGLNVRAGPSKHAAVVGSAAQGAVLELLGHTKGNGGWYKVEGVTVTGWVTANPDYTARGSFSAYSSGPFGVYYPATWSATGTPATGVRFANPAAKGTEHVVITVGNPTKLPSVKQGRGVSESTAEQVVACGVTTELFVYTTASAHRYLASARVPLAAHRAIGLEATLTAKSQVATVLDFVNSLTFPLVVCVGAPPTPHTHRHKKQT